MPEGPKGERRPADVIGNAVHVMRIATGEVKDEPMDPGKASARKGGLIGGHARAPGAGGTGATLGQTLADQVEQSGIVQEWIDGIEQIVLEQSGLPSQWGVEEPSLVRGRGDHILTRVYRVRLN